VAERVDITLSELVRMLRERHGTIFAPSSVWRFFDRHAMTVKKNGARQRAGAARRRRAARRLGGGAFAKLKAKLRSPQPEPPRSSRTPSQTLSTPSLRHNAESTSQSLGTV